jgi:hypothetical protein
MAGEFTTEARRSQRRPSLRQGGWFWSHSPCSLCLRGEDLCETKPISAGLKWMLKPSQEKGYENPARFLGHAKQSQFAGRELLPRLSPCRQGAGNLRGLGTAARRDAGRRFSSMGVGSQTRSFAFGVPVPPMIQDHGPDARATRCPYGHSTNEGSGVFKGQLFRYDGLPGRQRVSICLLKGYV